VTRRRLWLLVLGAGLLGAGGCGLVLFSAFDDGEDRTTNTKSTALKTSAERVAFLGRYLKFHGPVSDAAFDIVWHDNSHGLPGPSDWSVIAAVRVPPADGPSWLAGAKPLASAAATQPSIVPPEWQVSSRGTSYDRDGARLVWHPEGVLEFAAASDHFAPTP